MIGSPAYAGAPTANEARRVATAAGSRLMARSPRIAGPSLSGAPAVRYCQDWRMSTTETPPRAPRLTAVLREDERVTPLELFFDLVFVLAITQCTALMANHPTWTGLARGLLVLGLLWWSWVGYAWLTSV